MELLKRLFRQLSHGRPPSPQEDATLLQMPIEVILLIAGHLPRQSLYTLAQSCCALQSILRHHFHLEVSHIPQGGTQSLDFFASLSQELVDRLVCDRCIEYHVDECKRFPRGQWREYQLNTMMPGCKRQKRCRLECCHAPHLCACHRRSPTAYIQKQHVELVLRYMDPSRRRLLGSFGIHGMAIPPQRIRTRPECALFWEALPSQPFSTYHYTIMSRVVQGRFLLFRQIRWTNTGVNDRDERSVVYLAICPALRIRGLFLPRGPRSPNHITVDTEYGSVTKCPYCMAEYDFAGVRDRGILRLWQDLGTEENPRHECCLDMILDRNRAQMEVGRIVRLFGPV